MVSPLRPGIGGCRKTKLNARQARIGVVLLVLFLSQLACTQGYISPLDLTATVMFAQTATPDIFAHATLEPQPADPEPSATLPVLEITPADVPPEPSNSQATPVETDTPMPTPRPTRTRDPKATRKPPVLYYTQAGDALPALAARFGVTVPEITSPDPIEQTGFLNPGQLLIIPDDLDGAGSKEAILPDSEVIFSPSAVDFDVRDFVNKAGGYLSTYREYLSNGWNSGAEVVMRVATENSINPRVLLSVLEYQSHWVYGQPQNLAQTDYPIGYININYKGLYKQLSWSIQQFSIGYYGWRAGTLTEVAFKDGQSLRLAPTLNAGSVAVEYLLSTLMTSPHWNDALYTPAGLPALHAKMFDNPWLRSAEIEPLFPSGLRQPKLELPFTVGHTWSLTGGPHAAWGPHGALAAIDFAPSSTQSGCVASAEWVTAAGPGLVVREGNGVVVVDMDGDGHEETGWVMLYLHISSDGRVPLGTFLNQDDPIGHPSCEGGVATGTHVHVARKYNGEWMLADGPIPFTLSGFRAYAGKAEYLGRMVNGSKVAEACTCGSSETLITRPKLSSSQ